MALFYQPVGEVADRKLMFLLGLRRDKCQRNEFDIGSAADKFTGDRATHCCNISGSEVSTMPMLSAGPAHRPDLFSVFEAATPSKDRVNARSLEMP